MLRFSSSTNSRRNATVEDTTAAVVVALAVVGKVLHAKEVQQQRKGSVV